MSKILNFGGYEVIMNFSFYKKSFSMIVFSFLFFLTAVCFAQIETTVEPFSGAKTYTSKYTFSDNNYSMHSISLVKVVTPMNNQKPQVEVYFLLNFNLPQSATLGDSMEIQVTPRHVNEIPITPLVIKGVGYSSVPTFRTGFKQLPPMTVTAIEKGEELLFKINFKPKGSDLFTMPTEVVQEWAEILKIDEETNITN